MPVMIGQGGGVLLVGGKVALDPACCCGGCDPATVPLCGSTSGLIQIDGVDHTIFIFQTGPGSCSSSVSGVLNFPPPFITIDPQAVWDGSCWQFYAYIDTGAIYRVRVCQPCLTGIGPLTMTMIQGPDAGTLTVTFS